MNKKLKTSLLVIGIVLAGFLREYLFVNINWIYKTLTERRINQARKEFYFLLEWTPTQINTIKWILTVFFFALFTALTALIIQSIFNNRFYNKITLFSFLAILAGSGFLFVIGYLFGISNSIYHITRTLMGIGQSFMPLMILYVTFKFLPQKTSD
jgi:hypothetical protein